MSKKEIVFENVQKFDKWLKSNEPKDNVRGVFVMIGGNRMLVGCVVNGIFAKA